jgi:tetraacyldisaccharide 4'-kinase
MALKNAAYARRWLPIDRLQAPVISIGNLSVGGAGKTPLVIRIAELLTQREFDVDVLSRGYGRHSDVVEQVQPDRPRQTGRDQTGPDQTGPDSGGPQLTLQRARTREVQPAERYGDEPLLIAEAARVPVYVGPSRHAAGLLAEQRPSRGVRAHLLDDGFQHRRLARAVDIVVLHRSDFSERLLPAGRLREPLSSLRRASIAVLRVEDAAFEPELRMRFPALPVWRIAREITLQPGPARPDAQARPDGLPGPEAPAAERRAVAFCGIAHPEEFFASLTRAGVSLAHSHSYPDHHTYTSADIAALIRSVRATGACRLLTTEKDMVRLSAAHRAELTQALSEAAQPAILEAVPLRVRLLDEEAALAQLLSLAGLAAPGVPAMRKSEFA